MATRIKDSVQISKTPEGLAMEEIDRVNARLRHFRGVAASVMSDALAIWREIWDACQDPRSCEEILEDVPASSSPTSPGGCPEYLEKLYLLGTYIDYAKRLCEGSIDHQVHHESEVAECLDSSQSFQASNHPSSTRFYRLKKK